MPSWAVWCGGMLGVRLGLLLHPQGLLGVRLQLRAGALGAGPPRVEPGKEVRQSPLFYSLPRERTSSSPPFRVAVGAVPSRPVETCSASAIEAPASPRGRRARPAGLDALVDAGRAGGPCRSCPRRSAASPRAGARAGSPGRRAPSRRCASGPPAPSRPRSGGRADPSSWRASRIAVGQCERPDAVPPLVVADPPHHVAMRALRRKARHRNGTRRASREDGRAGEGVIT